MKKVYVMVAAVAAMSTVLISCTNELEPVSNLPVEEVQSGRIVFQVNTGKSVAFTKNATAEDVAIKSLHVYIVSPTGHIVSGVKKDYQASDIQEGKLAVTLPADLMNKMGLKAYLIANVTPAAITSEAQLLDLIATTAPGDVATSGIPMASAPIMLNTNTRVVTAEAVMKRSMSSLFVKVNAVASGETTINSGDFTYKVKNIRTDNGYLFKDAVHQGTTTAEAMWVPKEHSNVEELLGYMYQSGGFEIEVTPSVDKPELGTASRTVVVPVEKAKMRNKKYVLNIAPVSSETGTVDFSVTVLDWDATDAGYNVDWTQRFMVKQMLPAGVSYTDNEGFKIAAPVSSFKAMDNIHFGKAVDLFTPNQGVMVKKVMADGLLDNGSGLNLSATDDLSFVGSLLGRNIQGMFSVKTEHNGVYADQEVPVTVERAKAVINSNLHFTSSLYGLTLEPSNGRLLIHNVTVPALSYLQNYPVSKAQLVETMPGYEVIGVSGSNNNWTQHWVDSFQDPEQTIRSAQMSFLYSGANFQYGYRSLEMGTHDYYCTMYVRLRNTADQTEAVQAIAVKITINRTA